MFSLLWFSALVSMIALFLGLFVYQNIYRVPSKKEKKQLLGIFHETHLYKVEKEGIPTSYLYGLMHIRKKKFVLPKNLLAKKKEIKTLITELDYKEDHLLFERRKAIANLLIKFYQSTPTLFRETRYFFDHLILYQNQTSFLNFGMPWLVIQEKGAIVYTELLLYGFFKGSKKEGLESFLFNRETLGKLGSAERDAIDTLLNLLLYESHPLFREKIKSDLASYDRSRVAHSKEDLTLLHLRNKVELRNVAWMPKILSNLEEGNALIAVGALHLFWRSGLIKKIEEAGYKVSKITEDGEDYKEQSKKKE